MHVHDHLRPDRIGMPEAVLCSAKTDTQLAAIIDDLRDAEVSSLLTRLPADRLARLPELAAVLDHDPISATAILGTAQPARPGLVAVVAAGTSALVSVLGGLLAAPIVAVPTSVGYGVAEGGSTALHSALASCAQGVTVVNIDNGFGAACAAVRMLSLMTPPTEATEA